MEIITDWRKPHAARGAAAAIGNFDGAHLGHQALLSAARRTARARGLPFGAITFEPHPRAFFAPSLPPFRLTPAAAKAHIMAELGVDVLYQLDFDAELSSMSAPDFAAKVLSQGLGLKHLAAGADFRFGAGRKGDTALLEAVGPGLGFTVETVALVDGPEGVELSSSAARRALAEGRPEEAARILGRPHRIEGVVQSGDKRGRTIGFPTANIPFQGLQPPAFGVYAVRARRIDSEGGPWGGVANIGLRPTFGGDPAPRLEVYLFDFSGDLYGAMMSVELIAFLRPEQKFAGLEALLEQIRRDAEAARAILSKRGL